MSLTFASVPRISAAQFERVLSRFHSPVAPIASACYRIITDEQLDPAVALAFFGKESTFGTRGRSVEWKSWGNMRKAENPALANPPVPGLSFATYPSWQASVRDWCLHMRARYVAQGLNDVDKAIAVYAPAFENDVDQYRAFVRDHVAQWIAEDTPMTVPVDATTYRSPNFNNRPAGQKPIALLLHTTEGAWPSDAEWLSSVASQVSSHYVISPAAKVYQLVDDDKRAWHAGVGTYAGFGDWNNISIGIEVSHLENHAWAAGQREVLRDLCLMKIAQYHITRELIAAHRWIAPDRRRDPTDFPDSDLKPWIAGLYGVPIPHPVVTFLKTTVAANLRQGPGTTFPVVLVMAAGETAGYDGDTLGESINGNNVWKHRADSLGFVWSGLVVPA